MGVEIADHELRFNEYSYEPASVYPHGVVATEEIRDVDPSSAGPEVRLRTGETLFVPAPKKVELQTFCRANGIPMRRRPDIWEALLDPFLDTAFTAEDRRRTTALLARWQIDEEQADEIRARFRPAMVAYNFESGLWDWVHLGLSDLLDAIHGRLSGERHRLPTEELAETYSWAMALADRSREGSKTIE